MIINKSNINDYIIGTGLYCHRKNITSIEYIPDHTPKEIHTVDITTIDCSNNKLTSLSKLPSGLVRLDCEHNELTSLPSLPDGLKYLYCESNSLTNYPIDSGDEQWRICHNKFLNRVEIINKINGYK